jgi:hypothetical protein
MLEGNGQAAVPKCNDLLMMNKVCVRLKTCDVGFTGASIRIEARHWLKQVARESGTPTV